MIIQNSLFQFEDFLILRFELSYVKIDQSLHQDDLEKVMESYPVDMDYGFNKNEQIGRTLCFCKVAINRDRSNQKDGYSIFAEGALVFDSQIGSALSPDQYRNQIQISALNQAINQVRNYIAMATRNAPLGQYQLPMVDLGRLMSDKAKLLSSATSGPIVKRPKTSPTVSSQH